MFDTSSLNRMQRARGEALVAFDGARLRNLRQQGCAKALLPRVRGVPEAVFLNTAGGLTSGDCLSYGCEIDAGTLIATTQSAERAYRAEHGPAHVAVRHRVGPGGWLDWLPQETILFDHADLRRETVIDLAPQAGCLMLESVVLGRAAMGETVRDLRFIDRRRITRAGRPVFLEPFGLTTDCLRAPRAAILGTGRAFATLVLCAQDAQDALSPARAALTVEGVQAAASGFDGKCVVRLIASDGWPLRQQILKLMAVLRRGAPPPRVWQI
ncbi:MAG TPA: urease accessory protein UreD [Paenirhodobacter sp.]